MYQTTETRIVRALLASTIAIVMAMAGGCGGPAKYTANPNVARETLEAVLSSWKEGGSPTQWQEKSPKVVVQDFDWTAGAKLKSFELLGPGQPQDANLICKVKLVMDQVPSGQAERTVTYVVSTDPVLTVFRDTFQ